MEESGLEGALPSADPLQPTVRLHRAAREHADPRYHLMLKAGHVLERAEMARTGETIYLPSVEALRAGGTEEACADATDADLFLWAYQRRRELFPECGAARARSARALAGDAGKRRGLRRLFGGAAWRVAQPRAARDRDDARRRRRLGGRAAMLAAPCSSSRCASTGSRRGRIHTTSLRPVTARSGTRASTLESSAGSTRTGRIRRVRLGSGSAPHGVIVGLTERRGSRTAD